MSSSSSVRVLLVGAGNMGTSHGRAYRALHGFEVCGIVTRGDSGARLAGELGHTPHHRDFGEALAATKPDAVAIASFTETHVPYATEALLAGCHVFVEKPLAPTLAEAETLVALAAAEQRVLVVGYILRHHPSWQAFVDIARTLGKPLVMRMNLNQQSDGPQWATHKAIMATTSPLVDCGVHYVDVMSQMTGSPPISVSAVAARLTEEIDPTTYNYGQLQVRFADGSVGWYEAGWGPMMSEHAFFIKDVIGPAGSVSIESGLEAGAVDSSDVATHTATNTIRHHHGALGADGKLSKLDDVTRTEGEPDHDELCRLEQEWFLSAIGGKVDVARHLSEVLNSQRVVLAAEESIRTGRTVDIQGSGESSAIKG